MLHNFIKVKNMNWKHTVGYDHVCCSGVIGDLSGEQTETGDIVVPGECT